MQKDTTTTTEAVLAALSDKSERTVVELSEATGLSRSATSKYLVALESSGQARRLPGGRDEDGRRQPDRWEAAEPHSGSQDAAEPAVEAPTRLAKGALGDLVREHLAAHEGEALGPSAIGKGLGRSQGAVANALERMVAAGLVERVSDRPRRYALVNTTVADAETTSAAAAGEV